MASTSAAVASSAPNALSQTPMDNPYFSDMASVFTPEVQLKLKARRLFLQRHTCKMETSEARAPIPAALAAAMRQVRANGAGTTAANGQSSEDRAEDDQTANACEIQSLANTSAESSGVNPDKENEAPEAASGGTTGATRVNQKKTTSKKSAKKSIKKRTANPKSTKRKADALDASEAVDSAPRVTKRVRNKFVAEPTDRVTRSSMAGASEKNDVSQQDENREVAPAGDEKALATTDAENTDNTITQGAVDPKVSIAAPEEKAAVDSKCDTPNVSDNEKSVPADPLVMLATGGNTPSATESGDETATATTTEAPTTATSDEPAAATTEEQAKPDKQVNKKVSKKASKSKVHGGKRGEVAAA